MLDEDERRRLRLAATLFGFVVVVQLLAMIIQHVPDLISIWGQFMIVVPAGAVAFGFRRGRRLRIGPIVFAVLWGALSTWGSTVMIDAAAEMAVQLNLKVNIPHWFVPLVTARSIAFAAATVVLVLGRPSNGRRIAGTILGCAFAALFLVEHVYQIVGTSVTR